jgi:hypothetical protein
MRLSRRWGRSRVSHSRDWNRRQEKSEERPAADAGTCGSERRCRGERRGEEFRGTANLQKTRSGRWDSNPRRPAWESMIRLILQNLGVPGDVLRAPRIKGLRPFPNCAVRIAVRTQGVDRTARAVAGHNPGCPQPGRRPRAVWRGDCLEARLLKWERRAGTLRWSVFRPSGADLQGVLSFSNLMFPTVGCAPRRSRASP